MSSSAMAIQAAKQGNKKKREEAATKKKLSYFQLKANQAASSLMLSKSGRSMVQRVEEQGETGVDIAESIRARAEKHKKWEASQVDVGEQKRLQLLAITSRFNEGLPISSGGTGELHEAIRHNLNNRVRQLISHSCDVDEMDHKTGYTALILAAKEENKAGAKLLLESGAEVRYQNRRGATALHFACKNGDSGIARLILESAYQARCVAELCNIRDTDGRTAREIAQGRGETQMTTKIDSAIQEEADVKAVEDMLVTINLEAEDMYTSHGFSNASTALHWVLEHGNMEFFSAEKRHLAARTVKKLVLLGANVNDQDSAGRTPLHYAAMSIGGGGGKGGCANTACARALLRSCSNVKGGGGGCDDEEEEVDEEEKAEDEDAVATVAEEIQLAPDEIAIDALDFMGMPAMYFAVERGDVAFSSLLLANGANVHFVLKPSGFSYLHVAAQRNFGEGCDGTMGEICEWLIDEEVDHKILDDYGRTAKNICQDVGTKQSRFVSLLEKAEDDDRQTKYRVRSLLAGRNYRN